MIINILEHMQIKGQALNILALVNATEECSNTIFFVFVVHIGVTVCVCDRERMVFESICARQPSK